MNKSELYEFINPFPLSSPDVLFSKCFPFFWSSVSFSIILTNLVYHWQKMYTTQGWQGTQTGINWGVRSHFRRFLPTQNKDEQDVRVACIFKGSREQRADIAIRMISVSET